VFSHVTVHASDAAASEGFYGTVLAPLGLAVGQGGFGLSGEGPFTRGLHIAFVSRSRTDVDAFWRAGVSAGYTSDGEPGERPEYSDTYYGAFLRDPDGNSVEAVFHGRERHGSSAVDHLWIRVGDLALTRRFWDELAGPLGLTVYGDRPERFHVGADDRSFALVSDGRPVSAGVDVGFPVASGANTFADPDGNRISAVRPRTPPGRP
jgi:catechol 2,3-dioxygenase-like lactoylglutathione lyase family enzyme